MTNLAYKTDSWFLNEWDYLVDECVKVFRLTQEEKETLYSSTTARIIATIPFEAGCNEPERTAIAHLGIYIMELKGFQKYCAHLPCDDADIFNRLSFISTFDGGNQAVIEHGMYMLALIMLEGYKKSMKKDIQNGIYNPLNSGKWDYKKLKKSITHKLNSFSQMNLDTLFFMNTNYIWD